MAALELWTGLQRRALGRALDVVKGLSLVVPQTGPHNRPTGVPAGDSFFSALQLSQNVSTGNLGEQHQRTPEFCADLAACAQFGITEPVASELAAREWVSPEYIEAHMRGLEDWDTRSLAVVRTRAGEDPPEWTRRGWENRRAAPPAVPTDGSDRSATLSPRLVPHLLRRPARGNRPDRLRARPKTMRRLAGPPQMDYNAPVSW